MANRGPQSKNWMATIFDLTIDPHDWPNVSYCVWQKEKCPKTDKIHLQLFVQFENRCRRSACLKLYQGDWRVARSVKDVVAYCQKEDTRIDGPWTIGEAPVIQGSKFHKLLDELKDGATEKDILLSYPGLSMRYSTGIRRARHLMTPARTQNTQIVWIWGPSGAGKTKYAEKAAKAGGRSVYIKDSTTKWWPCYNQQDCVIIDDFKGGLLPAHLFQIGGNSYPLQVEDKGTYVHFNSKEVYITSVRHPRYIYGEDTRAWIQGLRRRVTGYTLWINEDHEVFRTDWTPCYKDDPEAPPAHKRRKVIDDDDLTNIEIHTREIEQFVAMCVD